MPDPREAFETWLLQCVAHAVEAGEVPADLLTELRAEIAEARERLPEEWHALAVRELAERFGLPVDKLQELLAALEAQPNVTRELLLHRFAEAWFAQQRKTHEADPLGGDNG